MTGQLAILDHLVAIYREKEAWHEVKAYTRQKRHIFAHQNNQKQQAQMWVDLAELASAERHLEAAQNYYRQAEKLYGENGNFYEQAAALYERGAVAWRQGNYEQVRAYWQRSVEVYGQAYRLKPRIPSEQELDKRINMLRRFATLALWEDNVILAVSLPDKQGF